ncbi:MAG: hypothetical protein Q7J82_06430 [Coriobacteriia bacterium]|nr:hypothetical protein [Coriobacteriia bacterium]
MRTKVLASIAVIACLAITGCVSSASESDPALSAEVAVLEEAIPAERDEATASSFFRMVDMLFDDPNLHAADGRHGSDVLLDIADLMHRHSQAPPDSAPMFGETRQAGEYSLGLYEADALAVFMFLYPDDARAQSARETLASAGGDPDEWVAFVVDQHAQRLTDDRTGPE